MIYIITKGKSMWLASTFKDTRRLIGEELNVHPNIVTVIGAKQAGFEIVARKEDEVAISLKTQKELVVNGFAKVYNQSTENPHKNGLKL